MNKQNYEMFNKWVNYNFIFNHRTICYNPYVGDKLSNLPFDEDDIINKNIVLDKSFYANPQDALLRITLEVGALIESINTKKKLDIYTKNVYNSK